MFFLPHDPSRVRSTLVRPRRADLGSSRRHLSRLRPAVALGAVIAGTMLPGSPLGVAGLGRSGVAAVGSTSAVSSGVSISSSSTTAMPRTGVFVRLGERGSQVIAVQNALISQGISVRGGADGYFGPATMAAVRAFQERVALVPTGEVNVTTAQVLGLLPGPTLPARGDRGDLVRSLQQALINAGISVRGGADGIFGAATAASVTALQSSRGLAATGVVDMATAIALGLVAGAQTSAPAAAPAPAPAPVPAPATAPAPSPASSVSMTASVVMTVGYKGDSVTALQNALITAGVPLAGGVDGLYGAATARSVATYQTNMRLTPSGTVDTVTAQLLGLLPAPALPRLGDRSNDVAGLQQLLIKAGIPVRGGADGIFGPVTQTAISAFQQAQGLPVTGTVDLRTALFLGFVSGATTPGTVPPAPSPENPPAPEPGAPVITVFPVLGPCNFTDSWQAPRSGGRRHEGVDIIARAGTPIYAVTSGTITRQFFDQPGSLGGNALRLTAPNGTYFHYAHFSSFAENIKVGSVVRAGEIIGYVGSTGNTSTPHLHFEYHPGGGAAVNPYPLVKAINRCTDTTPPVVTEA